ncbi:MAG: hypothetical protein Q4G00_05995 [Clostridia bacterium]|nr:hypothetical protein [Clostridia bacterium]
MSEKEISQELRGRVIHARNIEEVRDILGLETTEGKAEQVWQEIMRHRPLEGMEEVDDDELDAVAGGTYRDYGEEGCSATVEDDSWCGTDDACVMFEVNYDHYDPCPKGGNHDWREIGSSYIIWLHFRCRKCGAEVEGL